jgi:hypothetical protein
MLEKVSTLFIGTILTLIGVKPLFVRGYIMWGRDYDFGPHHWVFGIIFIIGGLFIIYQETKLIIRNMRKGWPPRKED